MSSGFGIVLYCASCAKDIGRIDDQEFDAIFYDGASEVLCFDCDPESAATTPSIFWQWREGENFVIDGVCFEVWALPGKAAELVFARA